MSSLKFQEAQAPHFFLFLTEIPRSLGIRSCERIRLGTFDSVSVTDSDGLFGTVIKDEYRIYPFVSLYFINKIRHFIVSLRIFCYNAPGNICFRCLGLLF